jgi:predicted HTH transcriptional regulator
MPATSRNYRESKANKALESVVAKTLAGFLNRTGGALVIGVDDEGNVLGLEPDYRTLGKRPDRDGYQQFLVNLVSPTVGRDVCASLSLSISFHPADGREVCLVEAAASPKPVYIEEGGATRFYLRTGNATQELSTKQSVEYVATRWKI